MSQARENGTKGAELKCQKCQAIFTCRSDDIRSCHCSQMELSKEQLADMASRWGGCLCGPCLREISKTVDT